MTTQPTQSTPRPTHVVTNFLMRFDEGSDVAADPLTKSGRILIVQRSNRVGSYHQHWAGISGFVEPNVTPDEQAFTEIREETSLQRDQVRMLRRGAVVEYVDEALARHWYIHPFLFEVLTPDAIKTDWEAVDMRWIRPEELSTYDTVPRLQEAYDSAVHGEVVNQTN